MYQKLIEEKDTIYELDEECVNKQKEDRENGCYERKSAIKETKGCGKKNPFQHQIVKKGVWQYN